jgi:hypothetical protein
MHRSSQTDVSECLQGFGFQDFALETFRPLDPTHCPVRGCATPLVHTRYSKGTKPVCPKHGIRLHSGTFVYWNGPDRITQAQLRNFPVRPDLASEIALGSVAKAESHRPGYEMSEDALSWNVFVGLAEAERAQCGRH